MGSPTYQATLGIDAAAIGAEHQRIIALALTKNEGLRRGWVGNGLISAIAVLLIAGAFLPGADRVYGASSGWITAIIVGTAWIAFETAAILLHVRGADSPAYRVAATLDDVLQYAAAFTLVFLSGSAATVFLGLTLCKALTSASRPPKLTITVLVVTHVVIAAAFLFRGQIADAVFIVLMLLTSITCYTLVSRFALGNLQVQAERNIFQRHAEKGVISRERERVARELHDGVGAEMTALILQLRRAASKAGSEVAGRLAERAQGVLDGLRSVVWSLRSEQGTLAELCKLVDAKCRSACRQFDYRGPRVSTGGRRAIASRPALAVLQAAHALVHMVAVRPGITSIAITLELTTIAELAVNVEGLGSSEKALDQDRWDALKRQIEAAAGSLTHDSEGSTRTFLVKMPLA